MNEPTSNRSNDAACSAGFFQKGGARQFTVKLSTIILALVLAAVWLALWPVTSIESRWVLAAILLTWLFGCRRSRRAVLFMLPAMYAPHCWIFFLADYPWNEYRRLWASMFWQLPGLVPVEWVRFMFGVTETYRFAAMAVVAILFWLIAVTLGRPGRYWLWITSAVVFAISVLFSWLEQILFRV